MLVLLSTLRPATKIRAGLSAYQKYAYNATVRATMAAPRGLAAGYST
jgi:hypothetical protein